MKRMIWRSAIGLVCLSLLLSLACSKTENNGPTGPEFTGPTGAKAWADAGNVQLYWNPAAYAAQASFTGYRVYRGENLSIAALPADSVEAYRVGPAALADTSYLVTGLTQGIRYYFHIRSVKDSSGITVVSAAGNEVVTSPRPEGVDSVFEFTSLEFSAYSLHYGHALSMAVAFAESIDFYLGTSAAGDAAGGALKVKSPSERGGDIWSQRATQIKRIGTAENNNWYNLTEITDSGFVSQVEINTNTIYAIKTPNNYYAKIMIIGINGSIGSQYVRFRWACQGISNFPHL